MTYTANIQKTARHFLPEDISLENWQSIENYFINLVERDISTLGQLEQWLKDQSELEAFVNEDACWRQIKMTCDTENKALEESFNFFCLEIQPKIQPFADALNKKLLAAPNLHDLDASKYFTYLRNVKKVLNFSEKKTFLFKQNHPFFNNNMVKLPEQ
jgi:oligoendopeptidase F